MRLAPPIPPVPPTSVRIASGLLLGVAGLALWSAVVGLVFTNTSLSVYVDAYTGKTGSGFRSIAGATLDMLFAAVAAGLAVLTGRGRKKARMTAYVLGGLFLVCGGLGSVADPFQGPAESAGDGVFERVMPAAYGIGLGAVDALTALAVLAALVLMTLPPSDRFFQECERNRYVLVMSPPSPGGYDIPGAGVPHPFGVPPQHDLPPHTSSIPASDPWATFDDD